MVTFVAVINKKKVAFLPKVALCKKVTNMVPVFWSLCCLFICFTDSLLFHIWNCTAEEEMCSTAQRIASR